MMSRQVRQERQEREDVVGAAVVDAAIKVHRALGPGLLESVYEAALSIELRNRGFDVQTQVEIEVWYEGQRLGVGFRADMIVDDAVLVELKSVKELNDTFRKITLSYLKLSRLRLGFLMNFNVPLMKEGIVRIANGMPN